MCEQATAAWIAGRHPAVRGWVRNRPDGRVELLADGPPAAVEAFLTELRGRMARHIEAEDAFEREPDDTPAGFRIVG